MAWNDYRYRIMSDSSSYSLSGHVPLSLFCCEPFGYFAIGCGLSVWNFL